MAQNDRGGLMRFTYNGNPLVIRAKFDSEPSKYEFDGGANQDGSLFRTLKITGYITDPTFQDTPNTVAAAQDWEAIMKNGPYNISLIEQDTGRLYTWTGANFEGRASVNHLTGEVTGIKFRSTTYQKTAAA
jgi:hypothetical protein